MPTSILQTQAEKAIEDRDRQYRRYRAAKKAELEQLFETPVHGERLRRFQATLGHFGIDDADRMVEYVQDCNKAWLQSAPDDIRFAALQLVSHRIVRIRQRAGLLPFDDPLPGEDEDDVWQLCKRELGL